MNSEQVLAAGLGQRAAAPSRRACLSVPGLAWRRLFLFGLVFATALTGTAMMAVVLRAGGLGPFPWVILPLFALTFAWISVSFWTAVAGFVLRALRVDPLSLRRLPVDTGMVHLPRTGSRTAIVVPVYNEDPVRVVRGIEATALSLLRTGRAEAFDLYVLSDSNDPAVISAEQREVRALRRRLAGFLRVRYRRRASNVGRKAGNIADFCRRWGAAYEYMVVLDADSLMEGGTLAALVEHMEANPRAGLIQTLPLPVRQESLFGRFQQFANAVHSPMLGAGLAFWQGDCANYWGHNAIIRVRPFTEHCGLPLLPGRPPLGGEILSHDFVEAAFLRRAGWDVWLLPDLPGSYEELPANLIDYAKRDRRWTQGNLQHLRLLPEAGLHPISRVHFLFGALSYLASLFWILMLAAGTGAAIYAAAGGGTGSPWPDPAAVQREIAHALLTVTLVLLLLPKVLGIGLAAARDRESFGGAGRLVASGILETLYSVLLAPLMMAFHSLFVALVAAGSNVAWTAQPRDGRDVSWDEAWRRTGGFVLGALVWGALVLLWAPGFFWWVVPVLAGLLVSPWLVSSSGSRGAGLWLRRSGLLLAPSEVRPAPVLRALRELELPDDEPSVVRPIPIPISRRGRLRVPVVCRDARHRPELAWDSLPARRASGGS